MPKNSEKVFYPKLAGKTKQEILNELNERFDGGVYFDAASRKKASPDDVVLARPDIKKLTDELMQKYIDDCQSVFFENIDQGMERACILEGEELDKLARLIQKD